MNGQHDTGSLWPVVVVGAGAAGFMAALFAARGGQHVLLLETRRAPGAKIRVSGGSRCNVLPSAVDPGDYHSSGSPHALRNVLLSWPLPAVHRFFEDELGVPLKVEPTGKVFPVSDSSRDIVEALLRELRRLGVQISYHSRVSGLQARPGGGWTLLRDEQPAIAARRVVLACGGLSMPRTGSDGGGWAMARRLGHTVEAPYPALVPLVSHDPQLNELAGVAVPTTLRAYRGKSSVGTAQGDFLFTHKGFSGPAVLDISRFLSAPGASDVQLRASWGAAQPWDTLLQRRSGSVSSVVREHLPRRLADALLVRADVPGDQRLAELARPRRRALVDVLADCPLPVHGNEGYATAEVTAGGVPLAELHARSLESRLAPGIHLTGEMLDVTGKLGGYNFLWAWVTGRRVGMAVAA